VVLWSTMSAPYSMGRWIAGLAKVLSTTSLTRCRRASSDGGRQIGQAHHRIRRRLDEQQLRFRRECRLDEIET
jgi:hypothetical protein